jgi:hypothetical protein
MNQGPTTPSISTRKPPWAKAPAAAAMTRLMVAFCADDSGSQGAMKPLRIAAKKSSVCRWTAGMALASAIARATVVLPAPGGPETIRIGGGTAPGMLPYARSASRGKPRD